MNKKNNKNTKHNIKCGCYYCEVQCISLKNIELKKYIQAIKEAYEDLNNE